MPKILLTDLLKEDGFDNTFAAKTNQGEFSSACPFCGGDDRFRIWPHKGNSGVFWCRQCQTKGSGVRYLHDYRKLSYPEAFRKSPMANKSKNIPTDQPMGEGVKRF